jgi:signal transduction histidine kinase
LSKIEAGRTGSGRARLRPVPTAGTTWRPCSACARLDKGLALDFARAADAPRYIRSDENKLRQILINLLATP